MCAESAIFLLALKKQVLPSKRELPISFVGLYILSVTAEVSESVNNEGAVGATGWRRRRRRRWS